MSDSVLDILAEAKMRFASHKSVTLPMVFRSLPLVRGLLEARTALLRELGADTIEAVHAAPDFSRKKVFAAFDALLAERSKQ